MKNNEMKQKINVNEDKIRDMLSGYFVYFAGNPANLTNLNVNPFGMSLKVIDTTKPRSNAFVDLLNQLDGLSYGDKKLAMDKWVALDCGMLPSGFIGLARAVTDCSLVDKFSLPKGYHGLIPITEFCAIPTAVPGTWIGHTLATLEKGKGLLTKLLGIKFSNAQHYYGVAQYNNISVRTHSKISDLELLSAVTPAHSNPNMTFIYQHPVYQQDLADVIASPKKEKKPSFYLDPSNEGQKKNLQKKIKSGAKISITYPGQCFIGGELRIPIIES